MEQHDFSVAMCVYGGDNADYFGKALESVFGQTRMPNEVVLVVDGPISTKLESVITDYSNKYSFLKVFRLPQNMGHGIARNLSLQKCSNDYVAIADADDINRLDRFEKQMRMMDKDKSLSAVSSACLHFSKTIDDCSNLEKLPTSDRDIKQCMKSRCPLCQASTVLKKSDVEKAGGYQEWYHAEDYYLWVRMHLNGAKFANLEEPLLYVRSDDSQMKRRGGYKYFKSMKKLYKYMLNNHVINIHEYVFNVCSRFAIQVMMPSRMRGYIRKKLM